MTTEITTEPQRPKQSALAVMATKYQVDPNALLSTLKDTAFKGATDSQMMALCVVANEYGLNPFTKEIYAFPDSKSGGIVPIIGADGWYRIVNDHSAFDGCEFDVNQPDGKLSSITCRIYRKDRTRPVEVTEYLEECKRNTPPWNNQPVRMLRHRAFIQCARIAFGLSIADPEDAERTVEHQAETRDVTPKSKFARDAAEKTVEPAPVEVVAAPVDWAGVVRDKLTASGLKVADALGALATLGIGDGKTPFSKMDDATLAKIAADWKTVEEVAAQLKEEA